MTLWPWLFHVCPPSAAPSAELVIRNSHCGKFRNRAKCVLQPTNQLRNFHDLGRILPLLAFGSFTLFVHLLRDGFITINEAEFFHRSIGLSPRDAVGRARCQDRLPRMPPSRCTGPRWRYPCRRQLRLWHRPGESGISSKVGTELARVGRVHPSRTRPR